jgi:hypothetical protein
MWSEPRGRVIDTSQRRRTPLIDGAAHFIQDFVDVLDDGSDRII